jgi:adenine-specific DNA methylase
MRNFLKKVHLRNMESCSSWVDFIFSHVVILLGRACIQRLRKSGSNRDFAEGVRQALKPVRASVS